METGWPYTSSAGLQHDNLDLREVRFGSSIGFSFHFSFVYVCCLRFSFVLGRLSELFLCAWNGGCWLGYNDDEGWLDGKDEGEDEDDGGKNEDEDGNDNTKSMNEED
jgi:hypothetical protein